MLVPNVNSDIKPPDFTSRRAAPGQLCARTQRSRPYRLAANARQAAVRAERSACLARISPATAAHCSSADCKGRNRTPGNCPAISTIPGRSLASTGSPAVQASSTAPGSPSRTDGKSIRSAASISRGTSPRLPANTVRPPTPSTPSRRARAALSIRVFRADQQQPHLRIRRA